MFERFHPATEAIIGRIVDFAQRRAWAVVVLSLATAGLTVHYTVNHVAINTDTEQMLSEKLSWRAAYAAYKSDFPHFSDNIVIVIEGTTPDIARDAAARLAGALRVETSQISDVFYPSDDEFLRRNQLLYVDSDALQSLADELGEAQPFLARLNRERSSAALFDLLGEAVDASLDGETVAVAPAMRQISTAIDELRDNNPIPMSWQTLIMGKVDAARSHREIVVAIPVLDFSALLPAEPAIEFIRRTNETLRIDARHGLTVRLTGAAALSFDELKSVISGSQKAGTLALIMVLVCLLIGLRSLSLVVATLTSLVVGLVFTAGFAVSCVGTLNMISVAFAVLYVGLGVDFAIHICLRYREMLGHYEPDYAVNSASRHVGVSLLLCAGTTAIGFFAFIPTAYRGVAELGLIAGVGMFISLAVSIFLLPALLHVLPVPRTPRRVAMLPDHLASLPRRHARGILATAAAVLILAALTIPFTRFDHDPINLNDQSAESVTTFRDLLNDTKNSPLAIAAAVDSRARALELVDALAALPEVDSVRSIDSFVPEDQAEKLAIIDDLALLLGLDLEEPGRAPSGEPRTLASLDGLLVKLDELETLGPGHALSAPGRALRSALNEYRAEIDTADPDRRAQAMDALEKKLLASFDGRLALLRDSLSAGGFDAAGLPDNLRRRWLSGTGRFRIEAYPATDLSRPGETQRFVEATRRIIGDTATGVPVINLGASDAVKLSFRQAFVYAFVVISALLWVILRSFKEVGIVLAPLVLAGLITAAASVLFSMPFNFANIIALPLLLGIGVDSALHILHRYKTALPDNGNLLQTSTARGVFFSALTTVVSFGNLAASPHAGTASMGIVLSIGIVSTLACTLLVLPAMLKLFVARLPPL